MKQRFEITSLFWIFQYLLHHFVFDIVKRMF